MSAAKDGVPKNPIFMLLSEFYEIFLISPDHSKGCRSRRISVDENFFLPQYGANRNGRMDVGSDGCSDEAETELFGHEQIVAVEIGHHDAVLGIGIEKERGRIRFSASGFE